MKKERRLPKGKTMRQRRDSFSDSDRDNLIRETMEYNPETGLILRVKSSTHRKSEYIGTIKQGYLVASVLYRPISVHRIAWFLFYGDWPKKHLDHINGDTLDNRIKNLRDVSMSENQQNRSNHRKGRLVGTYLHKKSNRWIAKAPKIFHGKQSVGAIYLGSFSTEKEAHKAVLKFAKDQK